MKKSAEKYLSKREQQIMEVLYRKERATANELMESLPGKPSNSTVRTLLRILEDKNQVKKTDEAGRYIYSAVAPRDKAAKTALRGIVDTFFKGSVSGVVATLLDDQTKLTEKELKEIQAIIDKAKEEGR